MKSVIRVVSIFLLIAALCACGAQTDSQPTETAPTTTAAPTETQIVYPEPDKLIALTFDDGPNQHMDTILDVFAEYGGKASFYIIGKKIDGKTSSYIKRAFDEGHEIGSHSFSHEDMTVKTEAEILSEISRTQRAVKEIIGVEPVWYRPPFLRANDLTYSLIDMPHAGSAVSAGDGSNDNLAEDRHYRIISGAYDGAIALLHCNDITAEVLPQILHDLKMMGYEFVTTSELFARKGIDPVPTPGSMYKSATPAS